MIAHTVLGVKACTLPLGGEAKGCKGHPWDTLCHGATNKPTHNNPQPNFAMQGVAAAKLPSKTLDVK